MLEISASRSFIRKNSIIAAFVGTVVDKLNPPITHQASISLKAECPEDKLLEKISSTDSFLSKTSKYDETVNVFYNSKKTVSDKPSPLLTPLK